MTEQGVPVVLRTTMAYIPGDRFWKKPVACQAAPPLMEYCKGWLASGVELAAMLIEPSFPPQSLGLVTVTKAICGEGESDICTGLLAQGVAQVLSALRTKAL